MRHTEVLHFDTYFSTYLDVAENPATPYPNPFCVQFTLPRKLPNVRSVALKSVEMPIGFSQLRTSDDGGSDLLHFVLNGIEVRLNLAPRTYTAIEDLLSDLNTKWAEMVSSLPATFELRTTSDAAANQFYVALSFGLTSVSLQWIDTILSRAILGFHSGRVPDSGNANYFYGSARYNLSPDNYLAMHLSLPVPSTSVSSFPCTFKIPISEQYGSTVFWNDGSGFAQSVEISDHLHYTLDQLVVTVKDRFNQWIDPMGCDWTFSLEITYDE